jgi:hypothetical protein
MKFISFLVPLFLFSTFASGDEERPPWAGFSGQAMVRLAEKVDGGLRVQVLRVNRVWKNNRASKPESLTGQSILVGFRGEGEARMMQQAFASALERGQTFPLELGQGEGNRWFVLELNGDQRELAQRALANRRGDAREGDARPSERERDQPREREFDRDARPERERDQPRERESDRDARPAERERDQPRDREQPRERESNRDARPTERDREPQRDREASRPREGEGDLRLNAMRQEIQVELLRGELKNVHAENAELRFRLQQLENRLRALEKR